MKAQPIRIDPIDGYVVCDAFHATHVRLEMPRPENTMRTLILPVIQRGAREGTRCWSWNGDTENPTLRPSILTHGRNENGDWACHSWVNDGVAQFLDDCTHELAGQSLPLIDQ